MNDRHPPNDDYDHDNDDEATVTKTICPFAGILSCFGVRFTVQVFLSKRFATACDFSTVLATLGPAAGDIKSRRYSRFWAMQ